MGGNEEHGFPCLGDKENEAMKIEEFEPAIWIKTFIIMIFSFLEMRWEVTSLLAGLIMLDTLTGSLKAVRLEIGFKVKELWWGLTIKFLILLVPHMIALIGRILGLNWLVLVNLVVYTMIANDFTSILTNILSIKKKNLYKNFDLIELLFNWLKDMIRKGIEAKLKSFK